MDEAEPDTSELHSERRRTGDGKLP